VEQRSGTHLIDPILFGTAPDLRFLQMAQSTPISGKTNSAKRMVKTMGDGCATLELD